MTYIVKNLTRRPVSIMCNSGKSYHLPPKYSHEIASIELENNDFVNKLKERKILDVSSSRKSKTSSDDDAKSKKSVAASNEKPKVAKAKK